MRLDRLRKVVSAALVTAVLITGCASGPRQRYRHEYTLSPGQEHHAGLTKALLAPINSLNDDPVKDLEGAGKSVTTLIARHLESKGIEVEQVEQRRFKSIAEGALRSLVAERKSGASDVVSAEVDFGDAIPEILAQLEESPDLVIVPNIVIRTGEWVGTRTLVWDGVRRRDSSGGGDIDWGGTFKAASVQVIVFSKDGTRVFSGFGGLDLMFQLNMSKQIMEIREDLLQEERNLREGVCVAFYPYFGLEESCSR